MDAHGETWANAWTLAGLGATVAVSTATCACSRWQLAQGVVASPPMLSYCTPSRISGTTPVNRHPDRAGQARGDHHQEDVVLAQARDLLDQPSFPQHHSCPRSGGGPGSG